jgi:hypothetical protein
MGPTKPPKSKAKKVAPQGECLIPRALPKGDLHKLLFRQSEEEAQKIRDYVEWQAHGEEKVLHAEKVEANVCLAGIMTFGMSTRTKKVGDYESNEPVFPEADAQS